jgi:hypothetical protein
MNQLDAIDQIALELQARLEADPFFADIPVIVAEEGNIALELERKQALVTEKGGKIGAAVIILQFVADDTYENLATGPMLLRPAFQVLENLELNRGPQGTGKTARRIAWKVRSVIKPLALGGLTTEFVPDKPCIEPVNVEGTLVRAYQVNFTCYEAGDPESVVGTPEVALVADAETPQVALTCATEGAEIWYSVTDTFPAPGRAGAIMYPGPIDVPAEGLTIRVCGYKAGMIASLVARYHVSFSSP